MKLTTTAITLALLALGPNWPAAADNATARHDASVSPMFEFQASGRIPGPDDSSTLLRRSLWIDVQIESSGLDPATAYTAWAVVFNHPQYCAASPCSLGDLPFNPGHDPRIQASAAYVTGGFSGVDGSLRLEGRLYRAEKGIKPTETLFGPGLLNGARAEIHFLLRGHGPDSGNPLLSFGSYNGGCTETNACSDQQVSVHVAH